MKRLALFIYRSNKSEITRSVPSRDNNIPHKRKNIKLSSNIIKQPFITIPIFLVVSISIPLQGQNVFIMKRRNQSLFIEKK